MKLHPEDEDGFTHETTVRIGKPTIEEASDEEADNNIAKASADAQKEEDLKELDSCLAGIETFCGNLQDGSAAAQERRALQQRLKSKKVSSRELKTIRHRDRELQRTAAPPTQEQFIDNLKLYKKSFNIIAKYGDRIQQPTGPELVHILFNPLSYTVDASLNASRSGENVAAKVKDPPLTVEAKKMLQRTLTPLEKRVWSSMGHPWSFTEEEKMAHLAPLKPVVSAAPSVDVDHVNGDAPTEVVVVEDVAAPVEAVVDSAPVEVVETIPPDEISINSALLVKSPVDDNNNNNNGEEIVINNNDNVEIEAPPAPLANGRIKTKESDYARIKKQPTIRDGDMPEQTNLDGQPLSTEVTVTVTGENGEVKPLADGHAQVLYLDPDSNEVDGELASKTFYEIRGDKRLMDAFADRMSKYEKDLNAEQKKLGESTFDRNAKYIQELTVRKSEVVEILDDSRNWWFVRNWRGEDGYVPRTIVNVLPPPQS